MTAPTKRWRVDSEDCIPVMVECPEYGYPNTDADGRPQYENTHFDTEAEAWTRGRAEMKAGVSLARSSVRDASQRLVMAKETLVTRSLAWGDFEDAADKAGRTVMT